MKTKTYRCVRRAHKFWLGTAALFFLTSWSGLSLAQVYSQGWGTGYIGDYGGTSMVGTVRGTIQSLDFNQGRVAIRSNGSVLQLHARPQDLAGLNPGDVAGLTYLNYEGMLWLEPGGFYGSGYAFYDTDSFAISGEVRGTIEAVNRRNGTVKVAGKTLRAHPEQLDGLYPGSFVSLGYAQIGNFRWVNDAGGFYGGTGYFGNRGWSDWRIEPNASESSINDSGTNSGRSYRIP